MSDTPPAHDPNPATLARSWYATAATAALVAVLLLVAGAHRTLIGLAGILVATAAMTALTEAYWRTRRAHPSGLAIGVLAVLTTAAALLCLLGLLTASASH